MNYNAKKLTPNLWNDFVSYFEFKGNCSGCWCMNHRLPMGLDFEGEAAKLAMKELVTSERVFGVLAYVKDDPIPVGWCALDKKKTLPGHDCIGEEINCSSDIWSLHCVTSRSDYKNKGVENFLTDEAVNLAKDLNASMIEAYPEPQSQVGKSFSSWNTFGGYESHYLDNGFVKSSKELDVPEYSILVKKINKEDEL